MVVGFCWLLVVRGTFIARQPLSAKTAKIIILDFILLKNFINIKDKKLPSPFFFSVTISELPVGGEREAISP